MKNVPISIIMPVRNHIEFLRESIESMLAQTFGDFEFIIIDDGSTEPVWSVMQSFKDKRLRLYRQDNIGLTKSLNKCLKLSRGKFIARHDSDDISLPTRLQEEMMLFQDNVGLVSCWADAINEHGDKIGNRWTYCTARHPNDSDVIKTLKTANPIVAPGAIFSRRVYEKIGYFDARIKYAQDYNYWIRIAMYFDIRIIKKPLVLKRVHKESVWGAGELNVEEWLTLGRNEAAKNPKIFYKIL